MRMSIEQVRHSASVPRQVARVAASVVLGLGTLLLAGCQSMSYGTLGRDRLGYASTIADSWKEQMLLNLVKLRYLDTPVFMEVASVVTSYTHAADVGAGANVFPLGRENSNLGLSAVGRYSETPTVSYTPLTGERLVNVLLRPIPPESVLALVSGGGRSDFILKASVQAINGIYNHESTAPSRALRADTRFATVTELIGRISEVGGLGLRMDGGQASVRASVVFRSGLDEAVDADIAQLKTLLGLDAQRDVFVLTYGAARGTDQEIVLLTRSLQGVMGAVASGVEVPQADIAEGRATPMRKNRAGVDQEALIRVRASAERPADAFAAVAYRDQWFWIDDRDLGSKRMFRFLLMFASMVESGVAPQAPLLMIPTR